MQFGPLFLVLSLQKNKWPIGLISKTRRQEEASVCNFQGAQRWALEVFFNFLNNKKWLFALFIKVIWLGVGFLNGTGAEIGY